MSKKMIPVEESFAAWRKSCVISRRSCKCPRLGRDGPARRFHSALILHAGPISETHNQRR